MRVWGGPRLPGAAVERSIPLPYYGPHHPNAKAGELYSLPRPFMRLLLVLYDVQNITRSNYGRPE